MIPHLAVPLHLAGSRAATVAQDSDAHLVQQSQVILRTTLGSRPAFPDHGIPDPTQLTTVDEALITAAFTEPHHTPTIDVEVVEGAEVDVDERLLHVTVAGVEVSE